MTRLGCASATLLCALGLLLVAGAIGDALRELGAAIGYALLLVAIGLVVGGLLAFGPLLQPRPAPRQTAIVYVMQAAEQHAIAEPPADWAYMTVDGDYEVLEDAA